MFLVLGVSTCPMADGDACLAGHCRLKVGDFPFRRRVELTAVISDRPTDPAEPVEERGG